MKNKPFKKPNFLGNWMELCFDSMQLLQEHNMQVFESFDRSWSWTVTNMKCNHYVDILLMLDIFMISGKNVSVDPETARRWIKSCNS